MHNKKIVYQNPTRKSEYEKKIKEALNQKPTASTLRNSNNIDFKAKEKILQERIIQESKNIKRFENRTITENKNDLSFSPNILFIGSKEIETPEWFQNKKNVDVSIIIPLYKSASVLEELISTFPLENKYSTEIIFVDDCCPQSSKDVVLKLWEKRRREIKNPIGKIIQNYANKGYGQACNSGVEFASGKFLIFLNADTVLTPNWIEPMIELFQDSSVGMVGNLQIQKRGQTEIIHSAGSEWDWGSKSFKHIGFSTHKKHFLKNPYKVENAPQDLLEIGEREMVTGCCFAIKSDLFKYVGGFNPNYRIGYWEDTDLCMTVRELGYKIMFQPNSRIYHKAGHTSSGGHAFIQNNIKYFMNKWVHSHRIDDLLFSQARNVNQNPVKNILIKRRASHGDVLVASGVCAALKKKYSDVKITFATDLTTVVEKNPYIDEIIKTSEIKNINYNVFYDLDYLSCEIRPRTNLLDNFAEAVGVKKEDCKVTINADPNISFKLPNDYIVIHAGSTNWAGRNWPQEKFAEIAQRLLERGEKIVSVGGSTEKTFIPCTIDARFKTTPRQTAWIMKNSKFFIGIDSFPMHIAQSFNIPGIAFFGSVSPNLILYSKKMKSITANNLTCLGCHHNQSLFASKTTHKCKTNTLDCINKVSVEDMWNKIIELLDEGKNENHCILG